MNIIAIVWLNIVLWHLQVFSQAKVFFGIGVRQYLGEPVQFSYSSQLEAASPPAPEHARDVTIKLHHRLGRYLQLQFFLATRWLLLSEITFISGKQQHTSKSTGYMLQVYRFR